MNIKKLFAVLVCFGALSACSHSPSTSVVARNPSGETSPAPVAENNKLGTAWGENVSSEVTTVQATRRYQSPQGFVSVYYSAQQPSQRRKVNYIPLASVDMQVQSTTARNIPLFSYRNGAFTFSANDGEGYQLAFYNSSSTKTYEVVATVDGLDVLSGRPGSLSQSGYIVYPKERLEIKGFRKSDSAVAAFRFAKPDKSYAANSVSGDKDNTGVIGVAVFEMENASLPDCQPQAFPSDSRYAAPPCKKK